MRPSRLLQITSMLGLLGIAGYSQHASGQTYTTNYSADFENPPFTSGLIQGQDTWVSGTNGRVLTASEIATDLTAGGLVAGTTVHGGNQAFLDSGGGASINTTRIISGIPSYSQVVVQLWARPLGARTDAPSLGNIFMTLENSANTRAAAFRFGFDSATTNTHIDYADGAVGSVIWKSTGVPWDPTNTWYNLKFVVDYASQTYNFFINGTQANPSPIAFYTGNNVNDLGLIRIFRGTTQAGMIVDDLSISSLTPTNPIARLVFPTAYGFRYRILDVGTATPDTNSIAITLDGATITPTAIVQSGNIGGGDATGVTTVYYDNPSRVLVSGSSHSATIHYTGTGFDPVDQTNNFVVAALVGSLDRVKHYQGRFQGTPTPNYSAFAAGRTGSAGDFALDMQNPPGGTTKFFADDPDLLNALNKAMANDVLSCSIWTKRRTLASSSIVWLNSPNAPVSGRAFQLHCPYSDNTIYFDTSGSASAAQRLSTNVAYLGGLTFWTNWHHIVAIKNGGDKQVWIDGQLIIEQPSGASTLAGYNDLNRCIAGAASPDNLAANSLLDDYALYNVALTPADIAALYSGTAPNAIPSASGLISWWDYNDGAGVAIANSGGQTVVQFTQTLQSSTNVNGPYIDLPSATSPYTNTSGTQMFFRTRK